MGELILVLVVFRVKGFNVGMKLKTKHYIPLSWTIVLRWRAKEVWPRFCFGCSIENSLAHTLWPECGRQFFVQFNLNVSLNVTQHTCPG
jgi:hypothetical protein